VFGVDAHSPIKARRLPNRTH